MATQPALVQIDDWHIPDFIYEAEDLVTESPAQIVLDSPPSTIPSDEDSPPRQSACERLPPSEEIAEVAGSPSPVIEISDDEEDGHTRPRRRNTGRRPDYTYQNYQDTMEHAISAPPVRKRKREDSDAVDFRSKMKQFSKEVTESYEALEKENKRLTEERDQWKKDKKLLQLQIQYLRRQLNEQKRRNILKCALCHRTFGENWKFLGCGHTLCNDCLEDMKSKGHVFGYPCPYPECQKPVQFCLDFYPNVVEA